MEEVSKKIDGGGQNFMEWCQNFMDGGVEKIDGGGVEKIDGGGVEKN
jgi:F0F1-type ATP synthase membrane subunit a